MLTLRQIIAMRIYNAIWGVQLDMPLSLPPMVDTNPHDAPWLRAADECIRQMEWARRCVGVSGPTTYESTKLSFGEIVPTTVVVSPAVPYLGELTLAPEDWKPCARAAHSYEIPKWFGFRGTMKVLGGA